MQSRVVPRVWIKEEQQGVYSHFCDIFGNLSLYIRGVVFGVRPFLLYQKVISHCPWFKERWSSFNRGFINLGTKYRPPLDPAKTSTVTILDRLKPLVMSHETRMDLMMAPTARFAASSELSTQKKGLCFSTDPVSFLVFVDSKRRHAARLRGAVQRKYKGCLFSG